MITNSSLLYLIQDYKNETSPGYTMLSVLRELLDRRIAGKVEALRETPVTEERIDSVMDTMRLDRKDLYFRVEVHLSLARWRAGGPM